MTHDANTELRPGTWWRLRRLSDDAGRFKMLAVDQRPPLKNLVLDRAPDLDRAAMEAEVARLKARLVEALRGSVTAVLADPHYAYPAAFHLLEPRVGLLLTLEDSLFTETPGGRLSGAIDDWSVDKIARIGGDGVKVLAWYRPDASPEVRAHQQRFVAEVGQACRRHDIPFVFELLTYPLPDESGHTTDYVEAPNKKAEHVLESVETFADPAYGVDVFKLESPLPAEVVVAGGADVQPAFDALGRATGGRPWVMLSAGTTRDTFRTILEHAYRAGASGYLAGRAIWWPAVERYPDDAAIEAELPGCVAYTETLNDLTDRLAAPWWGPDGPPRLDGIGADLRHLYPGEA